MSTRTYIRRSKRVATTPLEEILEEEDEYSGGISGNEEQEFVSGDAATGTEEEFASGDNANGRETGTMNSEVDWEYTRPKMQCVDFTINFHCKEKIISDIKERLLAFGQDTFNKFKKGPFRQILELPKSIGKCHKAMHYVISREMLFTVDDEMEISYFIKDTRIRFRRFEFALITGLRFGQPKNFDPNENYEVLDSYMWHRLFNRRKQIHVHEVYDRFIGTNGKTLGDNPDDYVKAANIIFVYSFLFGQDVKKTIVPDWIWILVEFPKLWNKFPWGSASFQTLMKYLRGVRKEPPNGKKIYHLFGFAYAFMAWIYCAIPEVGKQCGVLNRNANDIMPRILRFTYEKAHPRFNPNFTQVFATLSPTEDESLKQYWLSVESEGAEVFDLKLNLDRPGGLCGSQNTIRLPTSQDDEVQPRDHSSSNHQHTTYVPRNVYYGPEDPIFSFAWSHRQTLIDDIAKKTHNKLSKDNKILEHIGEIAAARAVEEIMKKVPYFEEYVRDQAESSKRNEQDKRMNDDIVDYSILPYHIFREKVGPTPQYNCTPSKPSVFHDPNLSEDQYPSKLQFREVKMQAEFLSLSSPFRPYERRGIDYNKFLRSTGLKRNVGIGFPVNITFFKEIVDTKKRLEKHHIDAYIACLHTAPEFAGLDTWNAKATLTSPAFLAAVNGVWKKYHRDDELSQCDPNEEETISNKELNYLSQFVIGALPRWGKMKPWFDFDKVIFVAQMPFQWVVLCLDLLEARITVYDPTQHRFDEADFEESKNCYVPLARILPQVLRYSGFYRARADVISSPGQWEITHADEGCFYKEVDSFSCGAFALKQAEALFAETTEPFEEKDVKKYRNHVAHTIYHFSTDEDTISSA